MVIIYTIATLIVTFIIFNLITSKIFFVYKIFLYFKIRNNIKKIIPIWWKIKSISYITMRKTNNKRYETVISVISLVDTAFPRGFVDAMCYIDFDNKGNIILKEDTKLNIINIIGLHDSFVEPELLKKRKIELLRNKSFKELGV